VLVKPFHLAKQRLAAVLDASERHELAHVMLGDVLSSLDACREQLAGVMVVTSDREAMAVARRHEAVVLGETGATGVNAAITQATACLARHGAAMVVVPADLPHLPPTDLEALLDLIEADPAVALVRARDGGTNLLACRPCGVIVPSYGPDSFSAHCVAAFRQGITPTVRLAPRLALDLDRPEDLIEFLSLGSATRTHAYLSTLNLHERMVDGRDRRRHASAGAEYRM
jgi:2-phospho-L-lactate guanylyltransferase